MTFDIEQFPASEMAKKKARREIAEASELSDSVERLKTLIMAGNSGETLLEDYEGGLHELILSPAFQHGIKVAVRTLLEAGLSEEDLPIKGLEEKIAKVSLRSSVMLEAGYIGDPADLYLEVDGGNGNG